MATIQALVSSQHNAGTYNFGPVAIPDAIQFITLSVPRCTTGNSTVFSKTTTTLNALAEISLNGGASWTPLLGVSTVGGIRTNWRGTENTALTMRVNFPVGTGRLVRGSATLNEASKIGIDVVTG